MSPHSHETEQGTIFKLKLDNKIKKIPTFFFNFFTGKDN